MSQDSLAPNQILFESFHGERLLECLKELQEWLEQHPEITFSRIRDIAISEDQDQCVWYISVYYF